MRSGNDQKRSPLRLLKIAGDPAPTAGQSAASIPASAASGPRDSADNFYCIRYRVWYPSIDCAIRTLYQTTPACADCDQGRFNLRRHLADVQPRKLNRRRTRTLKELARISSQ